MAKKSVNKSDVPLLEWLSPLIAVNYAISVNTNLHHYFLWKNLENPNIPSLVIVLVITSYYAYKRKSVSTIGFFCLAIIATASFIWLSGFRANAFN